MKSIEKSVRMIHDRAEARIRAGCDAFHANWQASLEIMLLGMEKSLLENPGQSLPIQIDSQEEWEFHVNVLEKLDLPPDTCAVLITPSAFRDMPIPQPPELEIVGPTVWQRDAYSIIISHCQDWTVVMQVSLPAIESVGIDVFEDGKHLADYTYSTIVECLEDLTKVVWTYFRPTGDWSKERIARYTENWFAKSMDTFDMEEVKIHTEHSYVHNPELLNLTPLESVFRLIKATIPKEYDSLEYAIEITNDLNRDINTGVPVVTMDGIMQDTAPECQALFDRIVVEIDQQLDTLEYLEGVKFPYRNLDDPEYNRAFDKTARAIYEIVTGCSCPESIRSDSQSSLQLWDTHGRDDW